MKQIILVAHGRLATAMKDSAEMIFGKLPDISTVVFLENEGFNTFKEKLRERLNFNSQEILIFADLFGGTPYNAACALAMENPQQEISVLSGLSLPLLLELAGSLAADNTSLKDIISRLKSIASDAVRIFDKEEINNEEDL